MTSYRFDQELKSEILSWDSFRSELSALIAISGGQDSMCLVKLIENFNRKKKYFKKIEFIYIDHQWRSDCKYHIKHLINYLNKRNCRISIYQINSHQLSELIARKTRYHIITSHALNNQQQIILTGHSQTDQIETFFLNLVRGMGMEGVSSLNFSRKLTKNTTLLRPLIRFTRSDMLWLCRKFCLPIWSDKTNYKYTNYRNRIRNELLPYLDQYFGLQARANINHFLNLASIDNEYIKQSSIKLYLMSRHKNYLAMDYWMIKNQHQALRARVLQIFFYHHFNSCLEKRTLNQITKHICRQSYKDKKKIIFWQSLTINIEKNWIYIQ